MMRQRKAPGHIIVICDDCGASRSFRRENALARAAKVRAYMRAHVERECPKRDEPDTEFQKLTP